MAIDVKTYAQLAARVYDKKQKENKMTLPAGFEEVHWRDYRHHARTVSGCLSDGLKDEPSGRQPA